MQHSALSLFCPSQDFDLLLVYLADENDNHPLFTEGTYQAEVMENSPAGRCWAYLGGEEDSYYIRQTPLGLWVLRMHCVPGVRVGHRTQGVQNGTRGGRVQPQDLGAEAANEATGLFRREMSSH